MSVVTNFTSLQTAVSTYLNRSDLTTDLPTLIQMAEGTLRRDPRVRKVGEAELAELSAGAPTNWLITDFPDVYLYAVLAEAGNYLRDDDRVALWKQILEQKLNEISTTRQDPDRALALTTHAEMVTQVLEWMDDPSIEAAVPSFILLAEAKLRTDPRVRNLTSATFSITGATTAVPSDFDAVESWYHDGTTYYGPIQVVPAETLALIKARAGGSGTPSHAAVVGTNFRFAPEPSQTLSTKLVYWQSLTALSAGTNWLVEKYPHVYLYAALIEAAAHRDARKGTSSPQVAEWRAQLEQALNQIDNEVQRQQYSGRLQRQFTPIGG